VSKIVLAIFIATIFAISPSSIMARDNDEGSTNSAGEALSGTLMGGLLGAGLGAAIGSSSGHAGKGAAIGAGIGAVGGTLLKASEESNRRKQAEEDAYYDQYPEVEEGAPAVQQAQPQAYQAQTSEGVAVKKRVIRRYDENGNVVTEEEVKQ